VIPEARVQAHLHGGPHDGETMMVPWARIDIPVLRWEGDEAVVSQYRLSAPWRGQNTAEYRFVDPTPAPIAAPVVRPIVVPVVGVVARACLWLSRWLAQVAEARS